MKKAKRRYALKARREQVAATRARIVEAMVQLHQEVGPARTTVSAVAGRAGVERLTVYRHFQDDAAMLAACSRRFFEINPLPDSSAWAEESDPVNRARRGLRELYAFFGRAAPMFDKVYRDVDVSEPVANVVSQFDSHVRDLADLLASAWPRDKATPRRRVILRHATKFATWRSLETDGVNDIHKVSLMLEWLSAGE